MARTDLLTMDDLLSDISPERRAAWERLALARGVANALVAYRGRHKLSQRALAARLGVRPSIVGRLELAEHNPSIDTLRHLSHALGLHFAFEVVPPGQEPEYLAASEGRDGKEAFAHDKQDTRVLVAATAATG